MTRPVTRLLLAAAASIAASCAAPQIATRTVKKSDPEATALVEASQRAHGKEAFSKVRDVSVRYDGRWAPVGPRFQPVLADTGFRRGSEERLLVESRAMAQEHSGPAGKKLVVREPGKVSVAYDGRIERQRGSTEQSPVRASAFPFRFTGTRVTWPGELQEQVGMPTSRHETTAAGNPTAAASKKQHTEIKLSQNHPGLAWAMAFPSCEGRGAFW